MNETRYSQLKEVNPEAAESLLETNKQEAMRRYRMYQRYQTMDYTNEK
jgi:pyruvate-ferredoxin/flavodoxin oxidoreductase